MTTTTLSYGVPIESVSKISLYDIEFDTGKIISPLVLTKSEWESRHKITPF